MTLREKYLLTAITALAAALRFYGLGTESLWLDEAYVAERVNRSWAGVIYHWDAQWQGFLFAVIEKLWCNLCGRSEVALRFLPALFGTLAVPALYQLGVRLFSPNGGLYAALLLAANPFAIHYSQDARPYSLFLLLVLLSVEYGMRLLDSDSRRNRLLLLSSCMATLYVHPFGVFLLPLLLALPLVKRQPFHRGYGRALLLSGLLYLPMCAIFLRSLILKTSGALHDADFIPLPTWARLWEIYRNYFMADATAGISIALIFVAAIWGAMRKADLRVWRAPELLVICFVLLPVLLSYLITPIVMLRYTIPALAGVLLLLAWSFWVLPRWSSVLVLSLLLASSSLALFDYYTKVDKDPWRQTVAMMRPFALPGDRMIISPPWTDKPFDYYVTAGDAWETRALHKQNHLDDLIGGRARFWIINSNRGEPANFERTAADSLYRERVTIVATDSLNVNPRAFLVRRIQATLYSRTDEHQDSPK